MVQSWDMMLFWGVFLYCTGASAFSSARVRTSICNIVWYLQAAIYKLRLHVSLCLTTISSQGASEGFLRELKKRSVDCKDSSPFFYVVSQLKMPSVVCFLFINANTVL